MTNASFESLVLDLESIIIIDQLTTELSSVSVVSRRSIRGFPSGTVQVGLCVHFRPSFITRGKVDECRAITFRI